MNPLVSIYIPTRNRLELLKRAVYSVIGQTYRGIELIIVSDGSEDDTNTFIKQISLNFPVKLIINKKALGACNARNQAIEAAEGRFVTGLDDDDWFRPDRVHLLVEQWKKCESKGLRFSAICDSVIAIQQKGVIAWNWQPKIDLKMIRASCVAGPQIFTLKERYVQSGLFDSDLPAWQDWDLWIRLITLYGPAVNLRQGTYFVDQSHQQPRISTSGHKNIRSAYRVFSKKHSYNNARELSNLLISYLRYPETKIDIQDLVVLIRALKLKKVISCIFKRRVSWVCRMDKI